MKPALEDYLAIQRQRVDSALDRQVRNADSPFSSAASSAYTGRLVDAMRYTVLGGGKRLRPILFLATHQALEGRDASAEDLDRIAVALECQHAFSLIHDDLPAMDDDDLRRGRPSCHRAYDEATAILAGDALQSLSFELLGQCESLSPGQCLLMVRTLANAVGAQGMSGGQAIDLGAEGHQIDITHIEVMHHLKTGALIRAAVRLAAIIADAPATVTDALDDYAAAIGLAFQLRDDLLDVEGTTAALGKSAGSDQARAKATYVAMTGLAATRQRLDELLAEAHAALQRAGIGTGYLALIANHIAARSH